MDPIWKQGVEHGAGRGIGILVEGYVHPRLAALVHQVQHLLPHAVHRTVVMGQMHRHPAAAPDIDGLSEGVQQPVAQGIPGVRNVKAAHVSDGVTDRNQLVGVAVGPRRVGQPGGEAKRAVTHPLLGQLLHASQLGLGGQTVFPAHGLDPDGCVGNEVDHVASHPVVQQVQELFNAAPADAGGRRSVDRGQVGKQMLQVGGGSRRVREAVHPQRLSGNTLADLGLVARLGQQHQVRVGMHVNEAWADHISFGLDHAGRFDGCGVAPDHLDGVASNCHAGPEPRLSGAVHHPGIPE